MKRFFALLTLALGLSFMALSADDVTGTWKGTFETPNGSLVNTFVLKVDGDKVTGSVSNERGTQQIASGKVDGEKITFSFPSDYGTIAYSGTVKGDTIDLTLTVGEGVFTANLTATRVKT